MKKINQTKILFPIFTLLLLLIGSYSQAQVISSNPVPSNSVPDGIPLQIFSEMMVSINDYDPDAYQSFVENYFGVSQSEADRLLDVSVKMVESSKDYAQSELKRRCSDGSLTKTKDGNSTEAILQNLDEYRNDLYSKQQSTFVGLLMQSHDVETQENILDWVTGEFKSKMSLSTLEVTKAVNEGLLDIDAKIDSMCAF